MLVSSVLVKDKKRLYLILLDTVDAFKKKLNAICAVMLLFGFSNLYDFNDLISHFKAFYMLMKSTVWIKFTYLLYMRKSLINSYYDLL